MVVYSVLHEWEIDGSKGSKLWLFGSVESAEEFQNERLNYIVHNYEKKGYETDTIKKGNFIKVVVDSEDTDRVETLSLNQHPIQ